MIIDLTHNKILKDTVTEAFAVGIREGLVPALSSKYGTRLLGVQMYEDYLKDGFVKDGYAYYPLTVIFPDSIETLWIKWDISRKSDFRDGIQYSYIGEGIEFLIADDTPAEFSEKLVGRATYFEGGQVKLSIHTNAPAPTFLSGRFSQTFIDEMNRQISAAICRAAEISGIADSSIELSMVFAPDTYMEHTSENVTYRRLLISARGCAPRDFWIKWTRKNSQVAYSVKDNVSADDIVFELGEDVSHKIREKEYRFLVQGNSDKYRTAMGRKNITEWRELIKRAVRRGELSKTYVQTDKEEEEAFNQTLSGILAKCGVSPASEKPEEPIDAPAEQNTEREAVITAAQTAGEVAAYGDKPQPKPQDAPRPISSSNPFASLFPDFVSEEKSDTVDTSFLSSLEVDLGEEEVLEDGEYTEGIEIAEEKEAEAAEKAEEGVSFAAEEKEKSANSPFISYENIYEDEPEALPSEPVNEAFVEAGEVSIETEAPAPSQPLSDVSLDRAEREEYERRIKELTTASESLTAETERLKDALAKSETLSVSYGEKIKEQEEKINLLVKTLSEETEKIRVLEGKLKEQKELQEKAEAREKLLFAEAARVAREDSERLLRQREEAEAAAALEAARVESERRKEEEIRLAEEERKAEISRIEETGARNEEKRSAMERAKEIRLKMEEQARARAGVNVAAHNLEGSTATEASFEAAPKPVAAAVSEPSILAHSAPYGTAEFDRAETEKTASPETSMPVFDKTPSTAYTYTSKVLRLQFCHKVDPNITYEIHRLMAEALEKNLKSHVYMKVKANIPEESVVVLNFVKFPEQEMELLVKIINYLGKDEKLGIVKIILE